MNPKRKPPEFIDYLRPFAPLLAHQTDDTDNLVEAGKAFYLGTMEYDYAVTMTGHMPVRKAVEVNNNFGAA